MRVISGLRRGHRLKEPKGMDIRPTEDRIKESVFNIIGPIDENSLALDGFAGTGSIGIEFLSRGAKKCYFVDLSRESIEIINENLKHTRFMESGVLIRKDINLAIKDFIDGQVFFDYIYLDPPFHKHDLYINILTSIGKKSIIKENGIIIVEHKREFDLEEEIGSLIKYDLRNYGNKTISFYRPSI